MSDPNLLQGNWQFSMRRDSPRAAMAQGAAWNIINGIVQSEGAPVRSRAGWRYYSDITILGDRIDAGIYAIFSTTAGEDPQNIVVTRAGDIWKIGDSTSEIITGQQRMIDANPVFHGGTALSAATPEYTGLVIIPDRTLSQVPAVYNGTTLTSMTGNPPLAKTAAVYKDYTVLANGTVDSVYFPNRIWFSPPGDPCCATAATAWDTTYAWLDLSLPVKALAATRNVLLVFHDTQLSRLRGSTPPPEDDMVLDDPLYQTTLLDSRSICVWKDQVIYAAREGLIRTDGVTFDNLALRGGMMPYWQDLLTQNPSVTVVAGEVDDRLIVTFLSGARPNSGDFLDGFVVDLNAITWTRISNVRSLSMWNGISDDGAHELFTGFINDERAARLGLMFTQVGNEVYYYDGDDSQITMTVETSFYPLSKKPGRKRIKRGFFGFGGSTTTTASLEYLLNNESSSYQSVDVNNQSFSFSGNGEYRRAKFDINKEGYGVGFKFTGNNDFRVWDIGVESWPIEGSRIV